MKNHQMHGFIQAMYGTVLGVNFYKITVANDFDSPVEIFYAVLFCFTVVIVAHDWVYYHRNKLDDNEQKGFGCYIPQVLSLFFLAEMFYAISEFSFKNWYGFSLLYTGSNIVGAFWREKKSWRFLILKYITHIMIGLTGWKFFADNIDNKAYVGLNHVIALSVTVLAVVSIWICEYRRTIKEQGQKSSLTFIEESQQEISSSMNSIKTEIENILNNLNKITLEVTRLKDEMEVLKKVKLEAEKGTSPSSDGKD